MVASFDGTPLDVTLTLPAGAAPRRLPLVVFLHGFLNSKGEYLGETRDGTGRRPRRRRLQDRALEQRLVRLRGYAVLNYSARGHGDSGGKIELASKHIEMRDTHHLTGLLADDSARAGRSSRIHPRGSGVSAAPTAAARPGCC